MPKFAPRTRRGITALIAIALVAVAARMGLDAQQRHWIFQAAALPATTDAASFRRDDGIEHAWVDFHSDSTGHDVRLHALWLPNDDPKAPALLYLHGARRDVEDSAFRIAQMRDLGFTVLAVDYRGFGRSTDELPSETTVDEDARAGWAWLAGRLPGRDRYIFGHSLGGAIAVQLALDVADARGLIVEGTFTSVADVFRTFRWGWLPVGALITQPFDSIDKIGRVKVPVLVVHGTDDSMIPLAQGRALYDRATAPKRFVEVEGGTHYSTNRVGRDLYRRALHDLFGLGTGGVIQSAAWSRSS